MAKIILDEDAFEGIPELVQLRYDRGWSLFQIALTLGIDEDAYSNIEYGRIKNSKITERAREILESGEAFSPYVVFNVPSFEPLKKYMFVTQTIAQRGEKHDNGRIKEAKAFIFVQPAKGAHGITHYLFKDKGGSLESFTPMQLNDYRIEEAEA